ncbi:MAG: hypothetical protein J6K61_01940 [Clostridia bacterium]|nr:hypothetical protein [Clostridia bacterium]
MIKSPYQMKKTMTKTGFLEAAQRNGGWCEPLRKKENLSLPSWRPE